MSGAGHTVVCVSVMEGSSLPWSFRERAERGRVHLAERDVDGLLLRVEVQRPVTAFVPHAGSLDASERRPQIADVVRVQPDHAGLHPLREGVRALEVPGPEIGGEAVLYAVCQFQCLLLGVEWRDGDDRTEDLFGEYRGVGWHVGEHRRADIVAHLETHGAAASGDQAPLPLAALDVSHHLRVVLRMDQGPDLSAPIAGIAD